MGDGFVVQAASARRDDGRHRHRGRSEQKIAETTEGRRHAEDIITNGRLFIQKG